MGQGFLLLYSKKVDKKTIINCNNLIVLCKKCLHTDYRYGTIYENMGKCTYPGITVCQITAFVCLSPGSEQVNTKNFQRG